MQCPIISFKDLQSGDDGRVENAVKDINRALSNYGFFAFSDFGFSNDLAEKIFNASATFFASDSKTKTRSAYSSAEENFGYQAFASERLDPTSPPDLKETFTMRNILGAPIAEDRWPSARFKDLMQLFFAECLDRAFLLQRILARALDLDENFFVKFHTGQNISLRLLRYPSCSSTLISDSQLGAGAHTDYGLTTFLFQDSVGGLEICDQEGNWHDIAPEEGVVLINSGDLLERWTNGRYRSTPHRVQPITGGKDRFSIAFFVDPDSDTPVNVLESCISVHEPRKFADVNAGEYITGRLQRSHIGLAQDLIE